MPYAPDAILFDGTTDFMLRGGDLTGIADGKQGIVSCWLNTLSSSAAIIIRVSDFDFQFTVEANGIVRVTAFNSASSRILLASPNSFIHNGLWHHLVVSWDLAIGALHLYVDDQEDLNNGSALVIDDIVSYIGPEWSIGADVGGAANQYDGAISDLYLNTAEFLDLSIESNRRKFIDADGIAVFLGDTGELPTGTAAIVYMRGILTNQGTNSGTGGDFVSQATQVPGETTGPTEPNPGNASVPYIPAAILFDGTTDFMLRGAELTGVVDGKQGTISYWFRFDGGDGVRQDFFSNLNPTPKFASFRLATNIIQIVGRNAAAGERLNMFTVGTHITNTQYIHILAAWDLAAVTAFLFVDDVSDLAGGPTIIDEEIDYAGGDEWSLGASANSLNKLNGALSDYYFIEEFIDISVEANRRKFIDSSGDPVFLGDDGSLPTGTIPRVYLSGRFTDQGFNGGSGGDYVSQGVQVPGETPGPGDPGPLPGGPGDDMRHLARRTGRFHRFFRG